MTPLGEMIAAVESDSLCGLWFAGQKHLPADLIDWPEAPDNDLFKALRKQMNEYFSGTLQTFDLPLSPFGTPFQMKVWNLLLTIPCGEKTTYGSLAKKLNENQHESKTAARAIGTAVGRNPISVIIPCHRVIGADGSLTGYAGGVERKAALLALEQQGANWLSGDH